MTNMTNKKNKKPDHHDDTKILLIVAGSVVAGAIGIALLAGIASDEPAPEVSEQARALEARPAVEVADFQREALPEVMPVSLPGPAVETPDPDPVAFELEPGDDPLAVGLTAWDQRRFEQAVVSFDALAAERGDDGWVRYMLALALWKSGELERASEEMNRAIEVAPDHIQSRVNLSRIENDRGQYEAALGAADGAIEIGPDDAGAWFLRARSLFNLERTDESLVALDRSVELDDSNAQVHNLRGLILIGREEFERAADVLTRAAELGPDVAYIQNNLGMALERTGSFAEAVMAYRRATEIDPEHVRAAANLARLEPSVPQVPDGDGDAVIAAID